MLLTTRENLMGVRVIRAFNRQENEREKFEEENGSLVKNAGICRKDICTVKPCYVCDH